MKQQIFYSITVLLSLITIFSCLSVKSLALSSYSLSGFSADCRLLATDKHLFIVDINGKCAKIKSLDTDKYDISVQFSDNISSYSYCGGKFYFCRNSFDGDVNSILISAVAPDSYDGFYNTTVIRDISLTNKNTIAFDSLGNIYLSHKNDRKSIKMYDKNGTALKDFDCGSAITQLFVQNNKIYAVCDSLLFIMNNSISDTGLEVNNRYPFKPMQKNLLCDSFSNVYSCIDNKVNLAFDTRSVKPSASKVTADNDCVVCLDGETAFTYSLNSKELLTSTAVSADDIALFNSKLYLLKHSGNQTTVSEISKEKLITAEIPKTTAPTSPLHTEIVANKHDLSVSSSEYSVDNSEKIISNITVGTTVSQLKKKISYNCDFALYYKGKIRKTGNVGTGMTAVFSNDNDKAEYTLIIKGDCTGEGNVNSRDKKAIFDYILGEKSVLNGVYFTAADINGDLVIDTKDLLLTAKASDNSR